MSRASWVAWSRAAPRCTALHRAATQAPVAARREPHKFPLIRVYQTHHGNYVWGVTRQGPGGAEKEEEEQAQGRGGAGSHIRQHCHSSGRGL